MKLGNKTRQSVSHRSSDEEMLSVGRTPLEIRYAKSQDKLSRGRRKLLGMILENPGDTFFLSSRELAKRYDVDAATIVRTVQALGYRKFGEFAADLRSHFIMRITPYAALKAASQERRSPPDRLRHGMDMDFRNLQSLRTTLEPERVVALSKSVKRAHRIMVVGIDLAFALSWHLAYGLVHLGFPAEAPLGGTGNVQRRVRTLSSKDLLIAISFGQCLRETVEAALRAKKQGVPTFGITDSERTPIARVCDNFCLASVASPSFGSSYVAPMSVVGAILIACAHTQTSRTLALLRRSAEEDSADHRWYWVPENGKDLD
jgi:DNA-binding MurR/RpiR family transcriptional regulator